MNTHALRYTTLGLATLLLAGASLAQEAQRTQPRDGAKTVVVDEAPLRQPPTTTDADGKTVAPKTEKLVLADPDTKLYMPCRDENDTTVIEDESKEVKLNPNAAVLSEEAAKQHGYKAGAHKVKCPKQ